MPVHKPSSSSSSSTSSSSSRTWAALRVVVAAAAVAAVSAQAPTPLPRLRVDPATHAFVESSTGRTVLLHGTAIEQPWDVASMSDAQMDLLVEWGLLVMRVGFHWHLYETAPGVYNQTYLLGVRNLTRRFAAKGIYSILDMHQDSWSPLYCGGHGIPAFWATAYNTSQYWVGGNLTFPLPVAEPVYYPPPRVCTDSSDHFCVVENCGQVQASIFGWASTYATAAVSAAAQRLYDNDGGVQDAFARFWTRVALLFRNETQILGYELLNEPWLGDMYHTPELLLPGQADARNLAPLYAALHHAIRLVDNDTILLFEPATGGNILDALPVGFTGGPGGAAFDDRQALSFHVYCPPLQSDLPYNPGNSTVAWLELLACQALNNVQFDIRASDIQRIGGGGILSEFGSVTDSPEGADVLRYTADAMDRLRMSWAYWLLTPSTNASAPNWEIDFLARTYPTRVPGTIQSLAFNDTTADFSFTFTLATDPTLAAQTLEVVAVTNIYYPNGLTWAATPAGALQAWRSPPTNRLWFQADPSLAGQNITLAIRRP